MDMIYKWSGISDLMGIIHVFGHQVSCSQHLQMLNTCSLDLYLEVGSPLIDYTQETDSFIKSVQGDINVGKMLHNIVAHEEYRPYLRIRWIARCKPGGSRLTQSWGSGYSALETRIHHVLIIDSNRKYWSFQVGFPWIPKIPFSGRDFISTCLAPWTMNLHFLESCCFVRMESCPLDSIPM